MRGAQVDDAMGIARSRYSFYVLKGESAVQWNGKTLSGPSGLVVGVGNATAVALIPDLSVQARPDADQARLARLEPEGLYVWYQGVFGKNFQKSNP